MRRGEIYRSREKEPERGHKPGYYLVVSRGFIAGNERIETVICAPISSKWLGLETEVPISPDEGVDHDSAARCDFLMLLRKDRLQHLVGALDSRKRAALDHALSVALGVS